MAIEEPVDQMQVPGSTTACTHSELPSEVSLGSCSKGRGLFMTRVDPSDISATPHRLCDAVQCVADNSIDPPFTG